MTDQVGSPSLDQEVQDAVDAVRAGDRLAFLRLYDRFQSAVMSTAYSILSEWSRAEDVCQEVFLKVYEKLGQLQQKASFKAWLLTMTRHAAIDLQRVGRRETAVPEDLAAPGVDLESRRAFEELLAPLDADERLVVVLRYVEDLPYKDMAKITGRAEGSLRNTMCAALRKLRNARPNTGGVPWKTQAASE